MLRSVLLVGPPLLAACAPETLTVLLPAPGEVEVSVLVRPVVEASSAKLELRAQGVPAPVPIRVVDAADGTLEVQPLEPLTHATLYTVWVDGAPASTFRTTMNPRLGTLVFGEGTVLASRFVADRSGLEVGQDWLIDPGPDKEWLTHDDGIGSYTASRFEGLLTVETSQVTSPGPDMVWHTADDAPVARTRLAYNAEGFLAETRSDRPGADGQLDTADDELVAVVTIEHDEHGRPIREATLAPGPDARFDTSDDVPAAYARTLRDEAGRDEAMMVAYTPGPDNVWYTDDDFTSGAIIEHDALGRRARVEGLEPGDDGVLFTSDDVSTGRTQNLFDDEGRWSDNLVFDADYQLVEHHVLERGARGLILRIVSYGPDPKAPEAYTAWSYDDQGSRQSEHSFRGAGPDGIWFNADDPVARETRYAED